jgi:transcription elongation factor Elf1
MTIKPSGNKYVAYCDGCGSRVETGLKSFHQAVNYLSRVAGWDGRQLRNGGWKNYCPTCSEQADPDLDRAGIGFTKKFNDDE